MVELSEAQVHFALTDDGQLVLDGLGEDTEQEIFEFCYPALGEALAASRDVVRAVQLERDLGQGRSGGDSARYGAGPPDEGGTRHADHHHQPHGV